MIKPLDEKNFNRIGTLLDGMEQCGRMVGGGLLSRPTAQQPGLQFAESWTLDSAMAFEGQNPTRGRGLIYAIALTFAALLIWAGVSSIDEVVSGTGKAVSTSGTQVVQSVDGGVVEAILVKQGDRVEQGALLVRLDPTRFDSMLGQQKARAMTLQAKAARLEALVSGMPFSPSEELVSEIPTIVEGERELYEANKRELADRTGVIREQIKQRQQEQAEASSRVSHAAQAHGLAAQELNMTKPLLESGAVPKMEVLRLQKALAQASSELNQARAQVARIRAAIEEAEGQLKELDSRTTGAWRNELNATLGELEGLSEGSRAISDRILHSEVKAPIAGTVKRLAVNTLNAVVMPGGLVAEIVPDEETVFVDAQLSPKDRAFIRAGQEAVVKFTAYEYAVYGGMEGRIEHIAPDTVTDERGNTYYLGRIRIERSAFGEDLPILPGMVAQVDVKTGKRTVLSYLLRPLLRAKEGALKER